MTKFGAAENEMERLTAKFAQRTPTEHSLFAQTKNFRTNPKLSPKPKIFAQPKIFAPTQNFCPNPKFSSEPKIFAEPKNFRPNPKF